MLGLINALLGHHKDKDDNSQLEIAEVKSARANSLSSSVVHTAINEDVHVQSMVSTATHTNVTMKNSKKVTDLMNKLGSTHSLIEEYSRKRTAEISEAVAGAIEKVLHDAAAQQEQLLTVAHERTIAVQNEYEKRLKERVAQLDSEKVIVLAELERSLNARQQEILTKAIHEIDSVQDAANQERMTVLKEAQARANLQVDQITEKVVELAIEDAQRRLHSTTQTIITTKSVASGENHTGSSNAASTTTATASSNSRKTSESHGTLG